MTMKNSNAPAPSADAAVLEAVRYFDSARTGSRICGNQRGKQAPLRLRNKGNRDTK